MSHVDEYPGKGDSRNDQTAQALKTVETLLAAILAGDSGYGDLRITVRREGGQPVITVAGGPTWQTTIRP